MQHNAAFIRVYTFCKGKKIFRQKNTIDLKLYPDNPRYVQWTIPSLLYQTRRKNPLVYKGLRCTSFSEITFIIANNADPVQMTHFICIFTVCQRTHLLVSSIYSAGKDKKNNFSLLRQKSLIVNFLFRGETEWKNTEQQLWQNFLMILHEKDHCSLKMNR